MAHMPDLHSLQAALMSQNSLEGAKPGSYDFSLLQHPRQQHQHLRQQQQQRGHAGGMGGMGNHGSSAPPGAQPIAAAFAAQQAQQFAQQQAQQQALELQYPGLNLGKVQAQLLAAQQQQQQHALNGPRPSAGTNLTAAAVGRPPSVPPPNGLLLQQQQQQLQAYEAEMRMKQAVNIIAASQGMPGRLNLQGLNGNVPPPPLAAAAAAAAAAGRGVPPVSPAVPLQQKQAHQLQALDRLKDSASAREVHKAKEMAAQYQRQQLQQSEMLRRMLLYQQQLEQSQQHAGSAQAASLKQQQLQEALAKQDVLAQASARKAAEANHNATVQSLIAMRGFTPAQAQSFLRNLEVLRATQAQESIGGSVGMAQGKGMDPTERGDQRAATDRALMAAHISRMQQAGNMGSAEQHLLLQQVQQAQMQAQQQQQQAAAAAAAATGVRGPLGVGPSGGGGGGLEQAHARNLEALMSGGRLSLAQAQNFLRNASLLRAIRSHERTHFVPSEQQAAIQRAVMENEHINSLPLEQQPSAIEAMANALLPAHSIPRAQLAAARSMGMGGAAAAHLAQQAQQAQQPQLPFLQQVAAMASMPLGAAPPTSMQLPQSLALPPQLHHPTSAAAASMAMSLGMAADQLPLPFPPQGPQPPTPQPPLPQHTAAAAAAANMVSPSMPMGPRAANHLLQLTGAFSSAQQAGGFTGEHDQGWMASLLAKASPHVPPVHVSAESGLSGLEGLGVHAGMTKEQRRLALACVALQLARGGISVEQAINLGIMGGMSVTDVRFIVECYNAERERMRQGTVAASAAAQMPLPPTPSTLTSHIGSPSPSMTSSAADSEPPVRPASATAGSLKAAQAPIGPTHSLDQQQQQRGPAGGSGFSTSRSEHGSPHSRGGLWGPHHPANHSNIGSAVMQPRPNTGGGSGLQPGGFVQGGNVGGGGGGEGGGTGDLAHARSASQAAPLQFNAFSYGFFGGDGKGNGIPPAQATPDEDALEPLEANTGSGDDTPLEPASENSNGGSPDVDGRRSAAATDKEGHSVANGGGRGLEMGSFQGSSFFKASPGSDASGFGVFNSPGGESSAHGRLGQEHAGNEKTSASPQGQPDSLSAEERELLQAAADANHRLWEGAPDEEGIENNDDLAARLANLDLGSGFF